MYAKRFYMVFRTILLLPLLIVSTQSLMANTVDNAIDQYAWEKRQILVFAPTIDHPDYQQYLKAEKIFKEEFVDRKLQSWHIIADELVKLDKTVQPGIKPRDFRQHYGVDDNEFTLILIGYDTGEKLRQTSLDIDYVFAEIDQMPMRIQEMYEGTR